MEWRDAESLRRQRLGEAAAALSEPVRPDWASRADGERRIETDVGLHGVPKAAKVVHSLAGPADSVALGLAEPEQGWFTGDGLELLTLQVPVGEARGHRGSEGGDETVFVVVAEGEVGAGLQEGGILLASSKGGSQWPR